MSMRASMAVARADSGGSSTTTTKEEEVEEDVGVRQRPLFHGGSQIVGSPSFRSSAVNSVAVVPLLSTGCSKKSTTGNHSAASFAQLMAALQRHAGASAASSVDDTEGVLLVIPNSSLTRPGNWRYSDTPLRGFHWQHGCQRLVFGDGRPSHSRCAHDRLLNPSVRDWIDLCPSRGRTAVVIGVLNLHDCACVADLHRAEEELHLWASRYALPPYEVTALGRNFQRDHPLERLFVFDSFDETCCQAIDLSQSTIMDDHGTLLVAFPPVDDEHQQMMDFHLNVVINDLAAAIFQSLEAQIIASDAMIRLNSNVLLLQQGSSSSSSSSSSFKSEQQQDAVQGTVTQLPPQSSSTSMRSSISRIMSGSSNNNPAVGTTMANNAATTTTAVSSSLDGPVSAANRKLSLSSLVNLVSPENKMVMDNSNVVGSGSGGGKTSTTTTTQRSSHLSSSITSVTPSTSSSTTSTSVSVSASPSASSLMNNAISDVQKANSSPKLITPLDAYWERGVGLSARDVDALRKRDIARREKWAGDFALLAGSPLDAYERYLKAVELCQSVHAPDPLWYASALEGCAAAHIAMAEAGGYGVDEYLETNFSMPEEVVTILTTTRRRDSSGEGASGGGGGDASTSAATSNNATSAANNKRNMGSFPLKQKTLPEIVCALCEEALNITNRHEKLSVLHAELLLKLASYVAEASEGHLRCRWGEGDGCYGGEVDDTARWKKPAIAKLSGTSSSSSDDPLPRHAQERLRDMMTINSFHRTKQVCELLHEAVSIEALDAFTRVDIATHCIRMCLSGVKATRWRAVTSERIPLPRKAAFFTVVAADAMTGDAFISGEHSVRDFWLLACHLYGKLPNDASSGKGGSYGWAYLRAIILDILSLQNNSSLSLKSAEELLSLLSTMNPSPIQNSQMNLSREAKGILNQVSGHEENSLPSLQQRLGSRHGRTGTESNKSNIEVSGQADSLESAVTVKKGNAFARQLRESFATLTAGSSLLLEESRWTENDACHLLDVPLSAGSMPSLGCAWNSIPFIRISAAHARCLNTIGKLHRSLPTESLRIDPTPIILPIFVVSAMALKDEPLLQLERAKLETKKEAPAVQSIDPMATFFNPFANKTNEKIQATLVAEGEECFMRVELSNRLSVPIVVNRSQLEFRNETACHIKPTSLSFTLPPRAAAYPVHFPFCILSPSGEKANGFERSTQREFEVIGIQLTLLGRMISLPIKRSSFAEVPGLSHERSIIPAPFSHSYRNSIVKASVKSVERYAEGVCSLRIEPCPAQPRLSVCLKKTGAPLDSNRPLHITLTEGEIHTLPTLQINNYLGAQGRGALCRLQIFAVELPGVADKKIFDSSGDDLPVDVDFMPRVDKTYPLLRARCLSRTLLNLSDINCGRSSGSLLKIQIAASYGLENHLPAGGTRIKLRFRYRGAAGVLNEFWRQYEICLCLSCVSGPRISSMNFRPNVVPESSFADLCRVLAPLPTTTTTGSIVHCVKHPPEITTREETVTTDNASSIIRLGVDRGVFLASSHVVFHMTISNDTRSEIRITKDHNGDGIVGGFSASPLCTLRVHAGVSATIPVQIPRIGRHGSSRRCRTSGACTVEDLADQIVELTKLCWESRHEDDDRSTEGYMFIPRARLVEIIHKNPSFVQSVCEPPCHFRFAIHGNHIDDDGASSCTVANVVVSVGTPVPVRVSIAWARWIHDHGQSTGSLVGKTYCVTLEFLCCVCRRRTLTDSRMVNHKDHHHHDESGSRHNDDDVTFPTTRTRRRRFVWCGKTRKQALVSTSSSSSSLLLLEHCAQIVFCERGDYTVSACARFQQMQEPPPQEPPPQEPPPQHAWVENTTPDAETTTTGCTPVKEEVWLAPVAALVHVVNET